MAATASITTSPEGRRILPPLDAVARSGDTAFVMGKDRWTYERFSTEIDQLAAGLAARGIGPGDRIALHLANGPEIAVAYYACFRVGAIAAPLNLRFKPAELRAVLTLLKPSLYIGDAVHYPLIAGLAGSILGVEDRYVVGRSGEARPWTALLSDPASVPPPGPADRDAPAVLLLTSGTTGKPKLVAHSQNTLSAATDFFGELELERGGVLAFPRPMVHASGLFYMLHAVRHRMSMIMLDPADPDGMLDAVQNHGCTYLPVPLISCEALIERQLRHPRDLSSLRGCGISADICPPGRQEAFQAVFGLPLKSFWASTEGTFPFTYGLETGAVGRPRPGSAVKLVAEDGTSVPRGEIGELLVRGPHVALGYWRGPGRVDGLEDGWYRSGDMMRQDEEGNFRFVSRRKDLIVRAGSNISPVEVEQVIAQHEDVRDAAVIGVPDPVLGQRVVGFVQLETGTGPERLDEILESARSRLADYKMPEWLRPLAKIPRNALGKVDRRALAGMI
ncbi:MAG TPA: class I adenylate-forming enzyme family protein [Aliidongia sp.]|nr:class I adenylate-forming enzyme family protein [Aliidongia sp.]